MSLNIKNEKNLLREAAWVFFWHEKFNVIKKIKPIVKIATEIAGQKAAMKLNTKRKELLWKEQKKLVEQGKLVLCIEYSFRNRTSF